MLSKSQLEYILALHEYKNFVKASEACFVTQPTLSMQLKKVEVLLGNALFDRDKNPVEMTSYGKKLLPYFRQVLDSYQQLSDEVARIKGTYKAEIRIGIIPTIAEYLVPTLYNKWRNELVGVHLEIMELKSEDLIQALEERKIDLGILAGPILNPSSNAQILFNEAIKIYAPKVAASELSISELEHLKPWLLSQGNCLRTQMMNFCNLDTQQTTDDWSYEGGSLSILLQMVDQQGGYTLIPENYIALLKLPPTAIKSIKNHQPARQIIAIENTRNTKKNHLDQLKRIIQHEMNQKTSVEPSKVTLLPWK